MLKLWETMHALVTRLGTNPLTGQTVLIAVGSERVPVALARELARAGCKLAVGAGDARALAEARMDLEATGAAVIARVCDPSNPEEIQTLVQAVLHRFGSLDWLLTWSDGSPGLPMEQAMQRTFWSAYHPTRAVLPHMHERQAGRIVHVRTQAGSRDLAQSTADGALTGFSARLQTEVAADHIVVSCVEPDQLPRELARLQHLRAQGGLLAAGEARLHALISRLRAASQRLEREDRGAPAIDYAQGVATRASARSAESNRHLEHIAGPSTLLRATSSGSGY